MPVEPGELAFLVIAGFLAGFSGGLLGIGGGVLMIPVLAIFLHHDQHLAQAVAMIVNVAVALPALVRHHRHGSVRWDLLRRLLPSGVLFIMVGVAVSDRVDGLVLRRIFGLFLVFVVVTSLARMTGLTRMRGERPPRTGWLPCAVTGAATGFIAGLLGIGGGPIAVPFLRRVCRLPHRDAIPLSSALICFSSAVGAVQKNLGLSGLTDASGFPLGLSPHESFALACCIIPSAVAGGLIGAGLTRRVPVMALRVAFVVLLSWAGAQMLGMFPHGGSAPDRNEIAGPERETGGDALRP
jgi:uncharacterized membrane protein YfcA